ncbi:MAG: hypothetical protein NZ866_03090, partial [Patescibacteria group bacterium]|nr:hypothetical protein [Patescibacteria group bacterium]
GHSVGNYLKVNSTTGELINITTTKKLKVNGQINVILPDNSGGFYIGGYFTQVGTTTRNYIAHILPDGTLNPNFNPNANADIHSMILSSDGNTLYVGGNFTHIGGATRTRIAALSATSGNALSNFNVNIPSGAVFALRLSSDNSILYFGGNFTSVNGNTRNRIAAVYTSDG